MVSYFLDVGILCFIGFVGSLPLIKHLKGSIRFMLEAAGSGMTQAGLNFWMVFRLGTTDDFKPEGAKMIKLWAKAGLCGSFIAKYKSR